MKEPTFNDEDIMVFGKYKGKGLGDVPAPYLHWLYTETAIKDIRLLNYIENSMSVLKVEHPDGVWKKYGTK